MEAQGRGLGAETLPVAHKSPTQRAFGTRQQRAATHAPLPLTPPRAARIPQRAHHTHRTLANLYPPKQRQRPTSTVTRVRTRPLSPTRTLSSTPPPSNATPCVTPTFYPLQTHTHSQAHAKHATQRAKTCAAEEAATARQAPPPRKHTQNSSPCPQTLTTRPSPSHI